ncbi:hypothetical protein ADK55_08935 [Streptomyces sp. WM4235]|nr:hypothetical protein ADK55_08935 [Streptomyces sp. WM4235]
MDGVTPGALLDSQAPGPSFFGQRVATLLHVDDLLSKVMDLQPVWQAKNSVPMQRCGVLIRRDMPNWLRKHR